MQRELMKFTNCLRNGISICGRNEVLCDRRTYFWETFGLLLWQTGKRIFSLCCSRPFCQSRNSWKIIKMFPSIHGLIELIITREKSVKWKKRNIFTWPHSKGKVIHEIIIIRYFDRTTPHYLFRFKTKHEIDWQFSTISPMGQGNSYQWNTS